MWEEKKKQWRGRGRGTHLGHLNVTVDFEAMDKRIYVPLGGPRILLGVPLRQAGGHSHIADAAHHPRRRHFLAARWLNRRRRHCPFFFFNHFFLSLFQYHTTHSRTAVKKSKRKQINNNNNGNSVCTSLDWFSLNRRFSGGFCF